MTSNIEKDVAIEIRRLIDIIKFLIKKTLSDQLLEMLNNSSIKDNELIKEYIEINKKDPPPKDTECKKN